MLTMTSTCRRLEIYLDEWRSSRWEPAGRPGWGWGPGGLRAHSCSQLEVQTLGPGLLRRNPQPSRFTPNREMSCWLSVSTRRWTATPRLL